MIRPIRPLVLVVLFVLAATPGVRAQTLTGFTFLGERIIANNANVGGTTVGGLSGLDYDATTDRFVSNSDDQVAPRFYNLSATISSTGFSALTIDGVVNLTNTPAFAFGNNDLENIRFSQNRQSVYITSEGNANTGLNTSTFQFDRTTGAAIRNIVAPSQFAPTSTSGILPNAGFESQTFTDNTFTKFIAAAEGPLRQDINLSLLPPGTTNPTAIFNLPQPLRIVQFDTATGAAEAQYAYISDALTEPVPNIGSTFGVQGLVDVLAIGNSRFLGLERSFTVGGTQGGGTGYSIRLYEFGLSGATDISGLASLVGQTYTPVAKNLLLDFANVRDAANNPLVLDNIEGLSFGGDLGNGQRALLFVSDNNFSGAQKTQFLAFGVSVAPEAGTLPLALAVLPVVMLVVRRRRAA